MPRSSPVRKSASRSSEGLPALPLSSSSSSSPAPQQQPSVQTKHVKRLESEERDEQAERGEATAASRLKRSSSASKGRRKPVHKNKSKELSLTSSSSSNSSSNSDSEAPKESLNRFTGVVVERLGIDADQALGAIQQARPRKHRRSRAVVGHSSKKTSAGANGEVYSSPSSDEFVGTGESSTDLPELSSDTGHASEDDILPKDKPSSTPQRSRSHESRAKTRRHELSSAVVSNSAPLPSVDAHLQGNEPHARATRDTRKQSTRSPRDAPMMERTETTKEQERGRRESKRRSRSSASPTLVERDVSMNDPMEGLDDKLDQLAEREREISAFLQSLEALKIKLGRKRETINAIIERRIEENKHELDKWKDMLTKIVDEATDEKISKLDAQVKTVRATADDIEQVLESVHAESYHGTRGDLSDTESDSEEDESDIPKLDDLLALDLHLHPQGLTTAETQERDFETKKHFNLLLDEPRKSLRRTFAYVGGIVRGYLRRGTSNINWIQVMRKLEGRPFEDRALLEHDPYIGTKISLSEKEKSLLRRSSNQFAVSQAWESVVSLFEARRDPSARESFVAELRKHYERQPEDVEFYLPQLCNLVLNQYKEFAPLRIFLMEKCRLSFHFALQTYLLVRAAKDSREPTKRTNVIPPSILKWRAVCEQILEDIRNSVVVPVSASRGNIGRSHNNGNDSESSRIIELPDSPAAPKSSSESNEAQHANSSGEEDEAVTPDEVEPPRSPAPDSGDESTGEAPKHPPDSDTEPDEPAAGASSTPSKTPVKSKKDGKNTWRLKKRLAQELMFELTDLERTSEIFTHTVKFMDGLVQVSAELAKVRRQTNNAQVFDRELKHKLTMLNDMLQRTKDDAIVYIPLFKAKGLPDHHRVVRIPEGEAYAIPTYGRVLYFMVMEVIDARAALPSTPKLSSPEADNRDLLHASGGLTIHPGPAPLMDTESTQALGAAPPKSEQFSIANVEEVQVTRLDDGGPAGSGSPEDTADEGSVDSGGRPFGPTVTTFGSTKVLGHHDAFGETWQKKTKRLQQDSPFGKHPRWRMQPLIVKYGDDILQEEFAMQLIITFQRVFAEAQVPVMVCPYRILATSHDSGLVEPIPNSMSLDKLKKRHTNLLTFFIQAFGPPKENNFKRAQQNFVKSLAGYSVVCYLLQLKDRHNGNMLVDAAGRLVHIDFGYFLSRTISFEKAPFKLNSEFVELMGGYKSPCYRHFTRLTVKAYLACRRHHRKIMQLVEMTQEGKGKKVMPCLSGGPAALSELEERFHLDWDDDTASKHMMELIEEARGSWRTVVYDAYQLILNNIH